MQFSTRCIEIRSRWCRWNLRFCKTNKQMKISISKSKFTINPAYSSFSLKRSCNQMNSSCWRVTLKSDSWNIDDFVLRRKRKERNNYSKKNKIIRITFVWTVNLTFSFSLNASEMSIWMSLSFKSTGSLRGLWNQFNPNQYLTSKLSIELLCHLLVQYYFLQP